MATLPLPDVVGHADWSVDPKKRWLALALREGTVRYRAVAPRPVGDLPALFEGLAAQAGPGGSVLLGVDFPLGLPAAYAARAGVGDFAALLPRLGRGRWREFFAVAGRPGEISLGRPFFPATRGAKGAFSHAQLVSGLGLASAAELRRRCDHATATRRAAAPLFWTLGPQQVGKAALGAWRDLLIPALASARPPALWPFDGPLAALLAPGRLPGRLVVAETYPAEVYGHLGLAFPPPAPGARTGKRVQAARAANAPVLLARTRELGVALEPALRAAIETGFGAAPEGEDAFDATVGLLGLVNVVRGRRPPGDPQDPVVRKVEGWILGQLPVP
jgi:hypothetical protein